MRHPTSDCCWSSSYSATGSLAATKLSHTHELKGPVYAGNARGQFRISAPACMHIESCRYAHNREQWQLQWFHVPWSPLSLHELKSRFDVRLLPPPKPSLKLTPARGPLKNTFPLMFESLLFACMRKLHGGA